MEKIFGIMITTSDPKFNAALFQAGLDGSNSTMCWGMRWSGAKLNKYCKCLIYLIANLDNNETSNHLSFFRFLILNYLKDSIFDNLLPGGLQLGSLILSCSKDLFISFIRARSRSHADFLYCSRSKEP